MNPLSVGLSLLSLLCLPLTPPAVHASPPPSDNVHFCVPFGYEQWRREHPRPATKRAMDLNVGEPRTVRLIYFVPDDRSSIMNIDSRLHTLAKEIQQFYADEMERNGFGRKTFTLETDNSERTRVHHVKGRFSASYYNRDDSGGVYDRVLAEIDERFDTSKNIYFIAADITYPGSAWRGGGQATLGGSAVAYIPFDTHGYEPFVLSRYIAGHELGHSFGLRHDFRGEEIELRRGEVEIMSYSVGVDFDKRILSKCAAEWLSVHPYFSVGDTSTDENEPTATRLLSPRAVPPNAVSLRFEVSDAEGLHQAQLIIPREAGFSLHGCKSLYGSRSNTVEFITTELTSRDSNDVEIGIIDVQGNFTWKPYSVWLDDETERFDGVIDVGDRMPVKLRRVSGDNQIGYLNARLVEPFVASVRDADDEPVAGIQVMFQVIAGDGTLTVTNPWTDSEGRARSFLTLGSAQGEYRVAANVSGVSDRVTFSVDVDATTAVDTPWKTLNRHTARVGIVAYSPDGVTLASGADFSGGGGGHGTVHLWNAVTGEHRSTITGFTHGVSAVAFSPDGRTLATNGNWGEIRLWDVFSGKHKQTLEGITAQRPQTPFGHTSGVSALAYSSDGSTIATGDLIGEIRLWNAVTGQHKATITGHPGANVTSLAFSPDGRMVASSGSYPDYTLRWWDAYTGAQLKSFALPEDYGSVALSPDGRMFAITGAWDLEVYMWDAATGKQLKVLTGHKTGVYPVAFSRDGARLATGSFDSEIRLWELATGDLLKILIGHTEIVTSVAFSPEGNTLASGSVDHTVKLWDVTPNYTPRSPDTDFDDDGTVGLSDFIQFSMKFGLNQGDAGFDARFDLDGDGTVGLSDFLVFVNAFGRSVEGTQAGNERTSDGTARELK